MSNILIINAAKEFGSSGGKLNTYLSEIAGEVLINAGHNVKTTNVNEGVDLRDEVAKYVWADTVIYQMPVWWMGGPWILKKYIDEVFTAGFGKLFKDDGRTRADQNMKYGSGGLLQGKKYMLSLTWNAPEEAFTDPKQFFEGKGVDGVFFDFHKANQFLGMSPLPTFMCNDVVKKPNVDADVTRYRAHLRKVFG